MNAEWKCENDNFLCFSFSEHLNAASDHLVSYLDRQDKKVLNTTYKELHELIDRIENCGYFDRISRVEQETRAPEETSPKDQRHPERRLQFVGDFGDFYAGLTNKIIFVVIYQIDWGISSVFRSEKWIWF